MRLCDLKVKIKTLVAESKIIREEERKLKKRRPKNYQERIANFREHRVGIVRREARASFLAYGFLRGRTYKQLESKRNRHPDRTRVENIVSRFSLVKGELLKSWWQGGTIDELRHSLCVDSVDMPALVSSPSSADCCHYGYNEATK